DDPPLIYHESKQRKPAYRRQAALSLKRYREHLLPAYRVLFDRYELRDIALKVVGIGSVGTYCEVALFTDPERSLVSPDQGSQGFGAGALRWSQRVCNSWRASRGRTAVNASRERYFPRMDCRTGIRTAFLRSPAARHEDTDAARHNRPCCPRIFWRSVRMGS